MCQVWIGIRLPSSGGSSHIFRDSWGHCAFRFIVHSSNLRIIIVPKNSGGCSESCKLFFMCKYTYIINVRSCGQGVTKTKKLSKLNIGWLKHQCKQIRLENCLRLASQSLITLLLHIWISLTLLTMAYYVCTHSYTIMKYTYYSH